MRVHRPRENADLFFGRRGLPDNWHVRKRWVIVWVVLFAIQCVLLYTPDVGDGPGALAPLWDLLRPLPGPTAMGEPGFDKIVHGSSFALIALVGILARWPAWLALGIPLVHAPISEIIQWLWIDGRAGDWRDVLADWAGVLLVGITVTLWRGRHMRRQFEGGR